MTSTRLFHRTARTRAIDHDTTETPCPTWDTRVDAIGRRWDRIRLEEEGGKEKVFIETMSQ